ncbi:MAG: biopolymer transporter ExbD [gamma proteobacterium symbiont of Bathyaustriella thionipta]|nr:biopolymer transporter ExbD [gamma proteobacterium symbiont of Bathyaustriella thionipta]MCU7951096.1 biopolymer transporter ExbD [gamma proteobacterium symbiont of Bathyaustriella thionipta]MCU7954170.1 biopolymer transporter ExbD [gamma proteobacterium symbiont of Bathyaustriella thionipta]MCU7957605.1 biopolymer transporter ExbD [gamma proteobacterium symbiont of Bathyaustriella thionipta]MCU7966046.1 biopolymer transporter ExbD [gamma proteobacterium symbiont of Bathyaustriella thionipta
MNFRHRKVEELDVNVTPLIDVVFLLLIFFMVSTTFDRQSELNIELPEASGEISESEKVEIEIFIGPTGKFTINGNEIINTQIETILRALREAAGDDNEPRVIITADKNTTHQAVMTAMDAARQMGFIHITFSAVKPE